MQKTKIKEINDRCTDIYAAAKTTDYKQYTI